MFLLHKKRRRRQHKTVSFEGWYLYLYVLWYIGLYLYYEKDENVEHQWLWWVELDVVKDDPIKYDIIRSTEYPY